MSINAPILPAGVDHIHHSEVTSTLDVARTHASKGVAPLWVTATRQTASRGRRGRPWIAPEGNFYGTLVVPCSDPMGASLRSFVAALALYDALRAVMGEGPDLSLKWPNDVLLNNGKVAGILLESVMSGPHLGGVLVGIGVNLVAAPVPDQVEKGATLPVSVIGESGAEVTPEAFLGPLAAAFQTWDRQFETYGFAPIRTAWLDRAAKLGETITARLSTDEVTGRFVTVDENGYLILETANGPHSIAAADVFF